MSKPEEIKRTARILEIVLMISIAPERYTRAGLAHRFEVSQRQITKDLEIIRHGLKLDLRNDRQGYYFTHTPTLPALHYGFAEGLALLMAVQAAQQVSGIASGELKAAVARLAALFPAEFQGLLATAARPPILTAQRRHRQEMLTLLNRALLYHNKIEITYETRSRQGSLSKRIVHPYHILPYVRSWQLIAYCERRQAILMFKVDRIHHATILPGSTYTPDPDFNPDDYIGNVWGIMRGAASEPEAITLRFEPDAGRWVAEEFWHKSQQIEILPDGHVLFRLQIAITPEFINWLLYYGPRVEVLEPLHLRRRVAKEHAAAAALYCEPVPPKEN